MKVDTYSQIKTLVPISVDGIDFPKDTLGAVVETYSNPEGYAVDLAIPDSQLVGGFQYHNVILTPEQFVIMEKTQQEQAQSLSTIFDILEVYCQITLTKKKSFNIYRERLIEMSFVNNQRKKGLIYFFILLVLVGISIILFFKLNYFLLFILLAAPVLPLYWGYLEILLAWFNRKTEQQSIRERFAEIKEENRCVITFSNPNSRVYKANLYDSLRFSSQNELQKLCIQEIQTIDYNKHKIYLFFKNEKEKSDTRKKFLTIIAPCLVLVIFFLAREFGFSKHIDYIVKNDPFVPFFGLSSAGIILLTLILLAFFVDTLPMKIYKKCLSLLEEMINDK